FLLVITFFHNLNELNAEISDKEVWNNVWLFFTSISFWAVEIYIAAIIFISLFYTEVSENLGQGVLNNFFTGKYHTPKVEERIFMFLDMKSSTTIAEKLGHVKYFEMLKEYYSDLSDPIVMHSGKIYQYAGDEVIVSWMLDKGTEENKCINCFFALKNEIRNLSEKYRQKFGVIPEFKAGIHYGNVTTGEIGELKKDIFFTGDVLNTAARIQGLCNSFNTDIIISGQLLEKLQLDSNFKIIPLGENELKGRGEKINLYTFRIL
ncbi:MAG TPA: adenylate/guanylate cyclase domain-containing protein, partial [Ignavibacteria bacterium]|nr:adenylate/guanylate cyclase domain-containing protein [Ignavibacteria bacterium]